MPEAFEPRGYIEFDYHTEKLKVTPTNALGDQLIQNMGQAIRHLESAKQGTAQAIQQLKNAQRVQDEQVALVESYKALFGDAASQPLSMLGVTVDLIEDEAPALSEKVVAEPATLTVEDFNRAEFDDNGDCWLLNCVIEHNTETPHKFKEV